MFDVGFGELLFIALVLILVVGPDKLPGVIRTVGKTLRTVRAAAKDLRQQSGIDALLDDEDFKNPVEKLRRAVDAPPSRKPLSQEVRKKEFPEEGTDLAVAAESVADATKSESGPT